MQAVKVYNMREVDELILLDITATSDGREPDFANIDDLADECFMPFTVGGGVASAEHVRKLLEVGADKVAMNTAAVENPPLLRAVADRFGSQCLVVSIDFRRHDDGRCEVFTRCGTHATGLDPVDWARRAEALGAGEILLTAIHRDGTMEGFDLEETRRVNEAISIPAIASGGGGKYEHFAQALREGGASDVAAASIFHFTEQTPLEAKRYLAAQGFNVRIG